MNEKKYTWHKIADTIAELDFTKDNLLQTAVNGKEICVAQTKAGLKACASKCPHAGGILADGFIDAAGNIACPLHRYKFSLQNGRNTSGEGYYLKTFPVEIKEEGIFVGIEENSFFSWLK
jgi:nitrite reductase/ring-hydroxylating ferredoxin subunit